MNFTARALLVVALLPLGTVQAESGYGSSEYRWARVVEVVPIHVRESVPAYREECWQEPVREVYEPGYYHRPRHARSGPIFGAIVGGLVGNQIGSGGGRTAATVAGAALGHALAVDAQHGGHRYSPPRSRVVHREVCRPVPTPAYSRRAYIEGYDVAYEYDGRIYRTRTDHDPGDRIRVRVDVRPVRY